MEVSKENQLALVVSSSSASFQDSLDSQAELLRCQIDQLQNLIITQCILTGINPLSQEMVAGALSIDIGKSPSDLLNPKARQYMQSVFSIKDTISKKESRAISILFGVTATQVQEFFASQRSRVRRFVRLSREKAIKSNGCEEVPDVPSWSDLNIPIHPVPLNCVGPNSTEEPSCSTQDEVIPGIDDSDQYFLVNILRLMREEETFSEQVILLEWILQIQNSSVLYRFLTKGGVMILVTWLSQAAIEEQTSVLHVILKVFCHLPLHKAIPAHMSAILRSLNELQFYRTSDISNRARFLLSKLSKISARSLASKKPNAMISPGDAQDETLLKQSIDEMMGNESWESKVDIPDGALTLLCENSENFRNLGSSQPMKLLMASTDDFNKKLFRGVSSSQTRERRKVQLVEQPGQKVTGRSLQITRSVPATQGRPLSADDIRKAKMRAQFMQNKHGKNVKSSSKESPQVKIDGPNACSSSQASIMLPASKAHVVPKVEEHKKPLKLSSGVSNENEATFHSKISFGSEEPFWKKCKRFQIPWLTPPEMSISKAWRLGTGENSKEVEVQKNRIRREKGVSYMTVQEIPLDPKEPWDCETDYDDTLTPEIPSEHPPDDDDLEAVVPPRESQEISVTNSSTSEVPENSNGDMPQPDLELLAVLLQNPDLVFALTSGQGGNLTSGQVVKLLDMIKANGVSSVGSFITGLVDRKAEEKVEVSLPSPTPSSNPVTSGWRPEIVKNPFSSTVNGEAYVATGDFASSSFQEKHPASRLVQPQLQINSMTVPKQPPTVPPLAQDTNLPSINQRALISYPNIQVREPDMVVNGLNIPVSSLPLANMLTSASPLMWDDSIARAKPSQARPQMVVNTPSSCFLPPLLPTQARPQTESQPPFISGPPLSAHSWRASQANNHNNYNGYGGGFVHAPLQPGPSRGGNEYRREPRFESWFPDNSLSRSQEYTGGQNYLEPRINMDHYYRPESSRPRDPSGFQDHGRNGNPRWGDRRR